MKTQFLKNCKFTCNLGVEKELDLDLVGRFEEENKSSPNKLADKYIIAKKNSRQVCVCENNKSAKLMRLGKRFHDRSPTSLAAFAIIRGY